MRFTQKAEAVNALKPQFVLAHTQQRKHLPRYV
jgi:hypothetical protein